MQGMWLQRWLCDLKIDVKAAPLNYYCDNNAAILLSNSEKSYDDRAKHILWTEENTIAEDC